jgi:hypothetical protein
MSREVWPSQSEESEISHLKNTFHKEWASLTKHAQTCVGTQFALEIELHLIYYAL